MVDRGQLPRKLGAGVHVLARSWWRGYDEQVEVDQAALEAKGTKRRSSEVGKNLACKPCKVRIIVGARAGAH